MFGPYSVQPNRAEWRGAGVSIRISDTRQPASAPWDPAQLLAAESGERWYVVQTLPRRELGAELQLINQRFRVFLPQFVKTVRHARKLRTVRAPLFTRYMFVLLDPDRHRWRAVNGTFGVSSLLTSNGRPEPVPHGVVEALLAMTDDSGLVRLGDGLQLGQTVRVVAGPFADAIGRLERLDDNGRVRVLLEIMGGTVPVRLDRSSLVAAA